MHSLKECDLVQDLAFSCKVEHAHTLSHSNVTQDIYLRETPRQGDEMSSFLVEYFLKTENHK